MITREIAPFQLGQPDHDVAVLFENPERPHSDELTFFQVRLSGPGLDAACGVESLSGDHGTRTEPSSQRGEVVVYDDVRLTAFLRELAGEPRPWTGVKGWRSLADELRFTATCDNLGHVDLIVTLQPKPWLPTWSTSVTLRYALGELGTVADELEGWFDA